MSEEGKKEGAVENEVEVIEEQAAKKQRVETVAEQCVLCFDEHSETSPLQSHCCPQCKKDAWKICLVCHEGILSRSCPVCRGDYAPLIMHIVPGDFFF
jgi:hypothetical protein